MGGLMDGQKFELCLTLLHAGVTVNNLPVFLEQSMPLGSYHTVCND